MKLIEKKSGNKKSKTNKPALKKLMKINWI